MSSRLRHPLILRGLLAERQLSYQEFADLVGCHKGTVANWCAGRKASVSDDLAERVLEVLAVTRGQLFADPASTTERHGDTVRDTAA